MALARFYAFGTAYFIAPPLSNAIGAPLITVYLLLGLFTQLATGTRMPTALAPLHDAALACITLAAGSELVVEQLRRNAREIRALSISLTVSTLAIVFVAFLAVTTMIPPAELSTAAASSTAVTAGGVAVQMPHIIAPAAALHGATTTRSTKAGGALAAAPLTPRRNASSTGVGTAAAGAAAKNKAAASAVSSARAAKSDGAVLTGIGHGGGGGGPKSGGRQLSAGDESGGGGGSGISRGWRLRLIQACLPPSWPSAVRPPPRLQSSPRCVPSGHSRLQYSP